MSQNICFQLLVTTNIKHACKIDFASYCCPLFLLNFQRGYILNYHLCPLPWLFSHSNGIRHGLTRVFIVFLSFSVKHFSFWLIAFSMISSKLKSNKDGFYVDLSLPAFVSDRQGIVICIISLSLYPCNMYTCIHNYRLLVTSTSYEIVPLSWNLNNIIYPCFTPQGPQFKSNMKSIYP